MPTKIESFSFRNQVVNAEFAESTEVVPGVICDVYTHPETQERDLAKKL